jgi:hypothetical protein
MVDAHDLVTYFIPTPIFEWYVVECGYKNKYTNDTCLKEIGLRAKNMITILGSIVNIIGVTYLYDHLTSKRIFIPITKQNIHTSSGDHEESGYKLN